MEEVYTINHIPVNTIHILLILYLTQKQEQHPADWGLLSPSYTSSKIFPKTAFQP